MKWYNYLKNNGQNRGPALLDYENVEASNLVVLHKITYHIFGRFNNYLDFAKHMIKEVPSEKRCFYETVFGDTPQKPYFDIEFYTSKDIEVNSMTPEGDLVIPEKEADLSVLKLIDCIYEELYILTETIIKESGKTCPLKLNMSHILVFTSHRENKRSYHIVVEGFNFSNHKENKEFHDRVIKRMPENWVNIVDHVMYKSLQQFRIVGNTKWQTNRYKTLNEDLTMNFLKRRGWIPKLPIESEDHKLILLLEASLITQTSGCIHLLCKPEEKKFFGIDSEEARERLGENFNPLTPDDIKEALTLCYKYAGLEYGDPRFPYSYLQTVENNGLSSLILLKRHRPSECAICHRLHEHENPFLMIYGKDREVYLDCRRNAEKKKLHVGSLGPVKVSSPKSVKSENSEVKEKIIITIPEPKPAFNPYELNNSVSKLNPKKPSKEILPTLNEIEYKFKLSAIEAPVPTETKTLGKFRLYG